MAATPVPYNPTTNPTPQAGSGAYGAVPGVLNIPQNIYSQVNSAVPGLQPAAGNSASAITSQTAGVINPDVANQLQAHAAAMGIAGGGGVGQTGSFTSNNFLASLGENSQDQQNTGIANYLKFLGGVGQTQTDPNLAFQVSQQNAVDAAAPNPAAAAQQQQTDFDNYLKMVRGVNNSGFQPAGESNTQFAANPGEWDNLLR